MNIKNFGQLATSDAIQKTVEALKNNGFLVQMVQNGAQAKEMVVKMIPKGAQVMNMTSTTLDSIGVSSLITESGQHDAVRAKLMDPKTNPDVKRQLGAAPQWTVGSVHAVTQDGHIIIASNTGSQLPAYAYGAGKVIWVVGAQKIVSNLDEAWQRLYEYTLPLESERAHKAYGVPGSAVNKVLIVNKEIQPDRIQIIIVNEKLGF